MKDNDLQIKRLENFPVLFIFLFNVIVVVVVVAILYFFYDTYIFSFSENVRGLNSNQLLYFITEGYKKILVSFALWFFVVVSVNVGCAILIGKMKKAILSNRPKE